MRFFKNPFGRILLVIFPLVLVYTIYIGVANKDVLPIINPTDFDSELVDESMQKINMDHVVEDFMLINQNGDTITQRDYENTIYVADFFFTRCPSICPIMANNMGKLQNVFEDEVDVKFLSLSVTPELDSVPVLRDYADKNGVIDSKWNITTGDKKHIYNLARKSYFAVVNEGDGGMQDFIHTPNFVLIDKEKRIRGVYDGTNSEEVARIINDIKILKH